jgi:hypothetical protein
VGRVCHCDLGWRPDALKLTEQFQIYGFTKRSLPFLFISLSVVSPPSASTWIYGRDVGCRSASQTRLEYLVPEESQMHRCEDN